MIIRLDTTSSFFVKLGGKQFPINGHLIASTFGNDRIDIVDRLTRRPIYKGILYSVFRDAADDTALGANQATTITALNNAFNAQADSGVNVSDLDDVTLTSLANDHVLKYNSSTSKWVNAAESGGGGGGGGTNYVQLNWAFFDSQVRDVFLPFTTENESTSVQRYNRFIAPFDGKLVKCSFYGTASKSGGTGVSLTIRNQNTTQNYTDLETQTLSSLGAYSGSVMTFTNNSFSAGDSLTFWLENGFSSSLGNQTGTLLFQVD